VLSKVSIRIGLTKCISILGWYHINSANAEENDKKRQVIYAQAAKYYTDAAGSYFEDDEKHAYFLKIALDARWRSGSPLKVTLPLCARIRNAVTEMKKIWEFSADASIVEPQYKVVFAFEKRFRTLLEDGKATLDDVARPEHAVSRMLIILMFFLDKYVGKAPAGQGCLEKLASLCFIHFLHRTYPIHTAATDHAVAGITSKFSSRMRSHI
jgi:hypothetical protein